MLAIAFGLQPGGGEPPQEAGAPLLVAAASSPAATAPAATPTSPARPSSTPTATGVASPSTGGDQSLAAASGESASAPLDEVAGARATPGTTPEPDLSRQSTQCGSIQESSLPLSVEQGMSGVSLQATRAAVYPIEYLRCILMATGGREAFSLAGSVAAAARAGATHAVLIDLWITNAGREFGQVNLKTAALAGAGQTFAPLATLGGRSEVVVSSGQGRTVSLVVAVESAFEKTGPMTLTVEAPLIGGKQTAGKYQLFLPTP
jgi:hypothetical protein